MNMRLQLLSGLLVLALLAVCALAEHPDSAELDEEYSRQIRKPGFVRLGKRKPGFVRLGKRKPGFVRLGKRKPGFVRLGKKSEDYDNSEEFERHARKPGFVRLG